MGYRMDQWTVAKCLFVGPFLIQSKSVKIVVVAQSAWTIVLPQNDLDG